MSMSVRSGDEDEVMSTINTTPLVDVMLVMLIIFLITIPVIVPTVKVDLPEPRNIATADQARRHPGFGRAGMATSTGRVASWTGASSSSKLMVESPQGCRSPSCI